jgi:catechol 2,3-dioxygenase-like lactoylglutathione lyase family enzyme
MIKVRDIAHVRIRVPDLDRMETYLTDFGLVRADRSDGALYMRGTDPNHHCHITERGEVGMLGLAFFADSADDLREIATSPDASPVESVKEPGGGSRVVLTDPNGFKVEIVHGWEPVKALPTRKSEWNFGEQRQRQGVLRLQPGPSQVKRLGHVVIEVPDVTGTAKWYSDHFGLLASDIGYVDDPEKPITLFMRCDRGEEYVDHHSFLPIQSMTGKPGYHHAAFEVHDVNDVFLGHEYLKTKSYEHDAGIGRHILGSQVFDYWKGPWGFVTEHWTDGDLVNVHHKPEPAGIDKVMGSQWGAALGGPPPPE